MAVLENPQVKEWIEEQRRKIAEALRSLGEELDPQARRQAEAFAYEGRLPSQTVQESEGTTNAVAVATGRDTNDNEVARRNRTSSVQLNKQPIDAAERRRLGREYLARRNQEMLDMQERNKMRKSSMLESPSAADRSHSFDTLLNDDGTLKLSEKQLPSPPTTEPQSLKSEPELSEKCIAIEEVEYASPESALEKEMNKLVMEEETNKYRCKVPNCSKLFKGIDYWQRHLENRHSEMYEQAQKEVSPRPYVLSITYTEHASQAVGGCAFQTGSRYANPFGDEFEMSEASLLDRAATPKPPVPPKIALEEAPTTLDREVPIEREEAVPDNLSFEEQLARALSISLAESEAEKRAIMAQQEAADPDLVAAIAASLAEEEENKRKSRGLEHLQLVDVTPDPPVSVPQSQVLTTPRQQPVDQPDLWSFESSEWQEADAQSHSGNASHEDPNDELYFLSPQPTRRQPSPAAETVATPPYDPVHEAASEHTNSPPARLDLAATAPQTSIASLIDLGADDLAEQDDSPRTPTTATLSPPLSRDSIIFPSSSEASDDDFASVASHAPSEASLIDIDGDMDVQSVADSSDEEDSGVMTPGSWTDVGSEAGDEEEHA